MLIIDVIFCKIIKIYAYYIIYSKQRLFTPPDFLTNINSHILSALHTNLWQKYQQKHTKKPCRFK